MITCSSLSPTGRSDACTLLSITSSGFTSTETSVEKMFLLQSMLHEGAFPQSWRKMRSARGKSAQITAVRSTNGNRQTSYLASRIPPSASIYDVEARRLTTSSRVPFGFPWYILSIVEYTTTPSVQIIGPKAHPMN